MKTQSTSIMQNSYAKIALVTAVILAVPAVGGWPWGVMDYVFIGALVFGTGLAIDWAMKNVEKRYRYIAAVGIFGLAVLIWLQLAVGFIEQVLDGSMLARVMEMYGNK